MADIGDLHCGQSPRSETVNTNEVGVPYVTGPEQWDGGAILRTKWTTDPKRIAPKRSIFITVKGSVGEIFPGDEVAIGRDIYAFAPHENVEIRLVQHALQHSLAKIVARARGDIPGITKADILDHELSLPEKSEHQVALADKIDELFSQIDEGERALKRVQTLVERYRQSVLKAAVTGELTRDWRAHQKNPPAESGEALLQRVLKARRAAWEKAELGKMATKGKTPANDAWKTKYKEPVTVSKQSDLPVLPNGWIWASIDQLCRTFRNGLSRKPSDRPPGKPILRISAVRPLVMDVTDLRYYVAAEPEVLDPYYVFSGDLLFTRYNGSVELVGVSAVYKGAEPVLHPDKLIKASVVDLHDIHPDYLAIAMNAGVSKRHITQRVKTSAGQHGIAGADIKNAPVPLPPFTEQLAIIEAFNLAESRCTEASSISGQQLVAANSARQAILKTAFAGQLISPNPANEAVPSSESA